MCKCWDDVSGATRFSGSEVEAGIAKPPVGRRWDEGENPPKPFMPQAFIEKENTPRSIWNEGCSDAMYFLVLRLCSPRFGNIDFERVICQGIGIEHADRLICIGL